MTILHTLIICCLAAACCSADLPRAIVVSPDAFQADVAPGWERQVGEAAAWGDEARVLRFPRQGAPVVIPVPDAFGRIDARAWALFLGAEMNPQRNAVRLLGRPDEVVSNADGTTLRWRSACLRGGRAAGYVADELAATLTISGGSFTWSYLPVEQRKPLD